MKSFHQLRAASAMVFVCVASSSQAQGDVAYDFRTTETSTMGGNTTKGESTAHAVMSKGRLRFEMSGDSRFSKIPGMGGSKTMTIIMPDTGKTFFILSPEKKQYLKFNPSAMMEGMQKMMESMGQTMTMEISGDDPKVEDLGAGPDVMGHHTRHFRVTNVTRIKIGAMGQVQQTESNSVSDEYIATDIKMAGNPFRGLDSSPLSDMFGPSAKAYVDKMMAARKKIVEGTPLRTETHAKTTSARGGGEISSVMEVTKIQSIKATPDMFTIPADYKQVQMPMMPGGPPPDGR